MSDSKVFLTYTDKDNYQTESVWATKENDYYRINNIPFFAMGIALEDLVSVRLADGVLYFEELIEGSGNSTVQMKLSDAKALTEVGKEIEELGCTWEGAHIKTLLAIVVPENISYETVKQYLETGKTKYRWDYKEACLGITHNLWEYQFYKRMPDKQKVFFVQQINETDLETEGLWCTKSGDNYVVESIPFVAKRISLGDTIQVEYDASDKSYYFDDFVSISGNTTVRLFFEDGSLIERTRRELNLLACEAKILIDRKIIAVSIPYEANYIPIKEYLDKGESLGNWQYEESCLAHDY